MSDTFTATTPDGPIAGSASGTGPPLLLLHGGPGLSDYMDLLSQEVQGWRAITYQQRGLTPSAENGPFTVERHVADAVAVLDELGIGQAVVLGHSWGGHLALHVAVAHPGRVTGLVLADPLGAVDDGGFGQHGQALTDRLLPDAVGPYGELAQRLSGPEPADADALASLRLLWPGYYADPAAAPPMPSSMRMSARAYGETIASVVEHLTSGFSERLREVTVPAVFVLGAGSPMPLSQGQRTAALMPGGEVQVVPAAGHLPWHEQPGCVARALTRLQPPA